MKSTYPDAEGHGGMAYDGLKQGDMAPKIKDYQKPASDFSQQGFSKTLEYVERQDRFQAREASELKKQEYKGRYS